MTVMLPGAAGVEQGQNLEFSYSGTNIRITKYTHKPNSYVSRTKTLPQNI